MALHTHSELLGSPERPMSGMKTLLSMRMGVSLDRQDDRRLDRAVLDA